MLFKVSHGDPEVLQVPELPSESSKEDQAVHSWFIY